MKLKQIPEDFIVEEIVNLENIKDMGNKEVNYNIYSLKKKNIENLRALSYISKYFKVPLKSIGYCGLKDRHGITTQYITVPKEYGILSLNEENLKLQHVGTSVKPLKIGDLEGNRFKITVRDIKKEHFLKVGDNLRALDKGAPNYYDEQRFGSAFYGKFIVKEILKNGYEEAMKIILTKYKKSENKRIKDLKRFIDKNWGDWTACFNYLKENNIKSKMFNNMLKELKDSGDFKKAFDYMDNRLKQLFVSAYQSYLWNECVKELLKNHVPKEDRIYLDYSCGTFLFYKDLDEDIFEELKGTKFPTIAPDIAYEGETENIIKKALKKEKIKMNDLNKIDFGKFQYHERNILSIPKNFNHGKFQKDELNKGKYKICLEFELDKGCYATMIVKRVFNTL
ncbi:MAG: tRNA pseudouridine13 synthase [Methanothermococcus sp.]|jgi:tRNA pseudouridine13 synthase|uniref:tRNA pseudouridine(13) synthase TruD n=1 Tax=Methanothermococcus TaxID=155862 RepID=UPI00037DFD25|nr:MULTISPECIES: tRNA pseudouridine(13) synthase TruD [Methanothermococcus]MDK2790802.1 tRNA pseudouridine13 synthase [Methanothermococcus sp.]MDK2988023.1 tRNA pseudouridine13 synthase [Methanothermococcus sp.]